MGTVRYTIIDGEIVSENRNGVIRDYVPDPLGSTVALLDGSQNQTDTMSYFPYGEVATRTGTNPTPFLFVGTKGYHQDSLVLTSAMDRTLATNHGRWITTDSRMLTRASATDYTYVANSPATYSDRTGSASTILISLAFALDPGQGSLLQPKKPQSPPYDRACLIPKSRQECKKRFQKNYCSCMCQCHVVKVALDAALKAAYEKCKIYHPGSNGEEYCSIWLLAEQQKLQVKDDDCRLECIAHHRPKDAGRPDTPCTLED